jgi:dihydropyrimidinase
VKRDLVVKNGLLVTNLGTLQADVFVTNGIISKIGQSLSEPNVPAVDAAGCLVFPGIVDAHVQLELPSLTDDFDSGTKAAACGGVTTIIDFADQPRGVDALKYLRERKAVADAKVNVDYSLHMSITDLSGDTLKHISTIVKEEFIPSFKLYLAYSRRQRMVNEGETFAIMREVTRCGGIVGVHAESDALVEYLTNELIQNGQTDSRYFPKSRPDVAEAISVSSTLGLARTTGCDLYVHHVSTALAVDLIANARRGGIRVWAETCPQYLTLTDEVYSRHDGYLFVMNPPIRASKDRERLWKAVQEGEIDTVGTDHCSYLVQQKTKNARFDQIPPGLPGIETLLPVMYTEGVAKGKITLSRLVEILCLNPARIFGLFPRKGNISVGSDGDLVIYNPKVEWTLRATDLHTNSDFCPYEGYQVVGKVEKTILRGEIVFAHGEFCGTPHGGQFINGTRKS